MRSVAEHSFPWNCAHPNSVSSSTETLCPNQVDGRRRKDTKSSEKFLNTRNLYQIARKHQVSDAVIHRWRERFFEGGKTALTFDGSGKVKEERIVLENQIEELQKVTGEQAVEIRF